MSVAQVTQTNDYMGEFRNIIKTTPNTVRELTIALNRLENLAKRIQDKDSDAYIRVDLFKTRLEAVSGKNFNKDEVSGIYKKQNPGNTQSETPKDSAGFYRDNKAPVQAAQTSVQPVATTATIESANKKFEDDDWDGAITEYTELIDSGKEGTKIFQNYYNRGYAYYQSGGNANDEKYVKAIKDYNEALTFDPPNRAEILKDRGDAHYFKEEYSLAIANYSWALEGKSDYFKADIYDQRAKAYEKTGDLGKALKDFRMEYGLVTDKDDKKTLSEVITKLEGMLAEKNKDKTGLSSGTVSKKIPLDVLGMGDYAKEIKDKFSAENTQDANYLLSQVLKYASKQEWLAKDANWKDGNTLEALKADTEKMALVKEMFLIAYGQGFGNMVTTLDKVSATDAQGALAAFWDGKASSIATEMGVSTASKKWWASEFAAVAGAKGAAASDKVAKDAPKQDNKAEAEKPPFEKADEMMKTWAKTPAPAKKEWGTEIKREVPDIVRYSRDKGKARSVAEMNAEVKWTPPQETPNASEAVVVPDKPSNQSEQKLEKKTAYTFTKKEYDGLNDEQKKEAIQAFVETSNKAKLALYANKTAAAVDTVLEDIVSGVEKNEVRIFRGDKMNENLVSRAIKNGYNAAVSEQEAQPAKKPEIIDLDGGINSQAGSQITKVISATVDETEYTYTKGSATNQVIDDLLNTTGKLRVVVEAMKKQPNKVPAENVQKAIDKFVGLANQPEQNTVFTKETVPGASSLAYQITEAWNNKL